MDKVFPYKDHKELIDFLKNHELEGLDSEYTSFSKGLVEKFGANGFDMNRWWVFTSSYWSCPACKRNKSEIVRLNKHGYLTAHLHEHHDHVEDFVKSEFEKISQSKEVVVADIKAQRFVTRLAFGFSSYDKIIICHDCNTADAKAKKIISAPKEFSFSPSDISEFIISTPNMSHEVDATLALKAWRKAKPAFESRLRLIKEIAYIAASNEHWYQAYENTSKIIENRANMLMKHYGLNEIDKAYPEKLLYETNKFKGSIDSWRRNRKIEPAIVPSKGEIDHLISMKRSYWERISQDWSCPCCGRDKVSCVRKSNKGSWNFQYSSNRPFYSEFSESLQENITVCSDCADAENKIKKEAENLSGIYIQDRKSVIKLREMSDIVNPKPHRKHEINNQAVDVLLEKVIGRLEEGIV
jgi:rubredoxin